jgi:DNA (cytosine-5)-methyltransferase 1
MKPRQQLLDIHKELIVDLFAGGGGMSKGIYMALGRHPDIAINHNDDALSMHRVNHPQTRHFVADVFEVDPHTVCHGRPVGHLHASPDCTHHSQAAGGQPRNEKRRALSWVVVRWAGQVKPRVITLENVKQVLQWGPLVASRCKETGRVITLDKVQDPASGKMVHRIAEKGEVVPREKQYLVPDKKRAGQTWKRFIQMLEDMGYDVKHKNLNAAAYGAGTTRERLFLHARNDGKPVTFPEPTHFKFPKRGQKKWSAAHEHIDFSIESQSIFERKKPLANATMRRIAKGMFKFVINNPNPYIVQVTQSSSNGVHDTNAPLNTITTAKGGEFALVTPVLIQSGHGEGSGDVKRWGMGANSVENPLGVIVQKGGQALAMAHLQQYYGDKREAGNDRSSDLDDPVKVITTENRHALVTTFLAQFNNTGNGEPNKGHDVREPVSTIISQGTAQGLVSANLLELRNNKFGSDLKDPVSTIATSGAHHALLEYELEEQQANVEKALRVSAFLMSYYGTENVSAANDPLPTITTKDRLALVTVIYQGTPHLIVDIKLRMLKPKELYSAQGFDKDYIFTVGHDGRQFSIAEQVRMVGNSVSPYPAAALIACCHEGDEMRLAA